MADTTVVVLAVEPDLRALAGVLLDVRAREDEHAARSAARVVHTLLGLGLREQHHEPHHVARLGGT